jgi:hypothetical protein
VTDEHHLLWILVAKLPENIPAAFPSKQSNFSNVLQMLALSRPFWSSPNDSGASCDFPSFILGSGLTTSHHRPPEHPTDKELKELLMFFVQNKKRDETGEQDGEPWDFTDHSGLINMLQYMRHSNCNILFEHVFQGSLNFLHRFDDFMASFDSMIIARKRYFRLLVLLQLQNVDWRLELANKEGAVSCRIFSLYYTTLALLDSERAIIDKSFGVLKSHDSQQTSLGSLNVDGGPQNIPIVRHFGTLKSLGSFFDILDPLHLNPKDPHHRMKFLCIFRSQLDAWGGFSLSFKWESKVLIRIKKVLDSCYNTIAKGDWVRPSKQNVNQAKVHDQPGKERGDREEEDDSNGGGKKPEGWKRLEQRIWAEEEEPGETDKQEQERELGNIDDLIIFRSILLCLLFCTAPDSSEMLSSGAWEHVIPII